MSNPVATIRHISEGDMHYDGLMFWCPGCERVDEDGERHRGLHMLPVNSAVKTPQWTWNGSLDKPTLSPSILTKGDWRGEESVCHSFMVDGQMQFLGDCTHPLAGQTVPLPPLPDWAIKEANDGA
jgi:hypothetical protein